MTACPRTVALIVAAGTGTRAGGIVAKQFAPLAGQPMIAHAYAALKAHPGIDDVLVVVAPGAEQALHDAIGEVAHVVGGATRRDSVANGIAAIDAPQVIDRYLAGMRLTTGAAQAFGVKPLFVWQPAPCYNWPGEATSVHTSGHADAREVIASIRDGYGLMATKRAALDPSQFLWLGDLQAERYDELYLDPDHYGAAFSAEIAAALADSVRALLGR